MAPDHPSLAIAQKLPNDVLCELYKFCAAGDPPLSDNTPSRLTRPDARSTQLAPTWCTSSESVLPNGLYDRWNIGSWTNWRSSHNLSLGWLRLTHVCAHWRVVGLSLARLWGDILPMFPHHVEDILARSRDAPVSLDMDAACRALKRLPEMLSSEFPVSVFLHVAKQQIKRAHTITFPHTLRDGWSPSLLRDARLPYLETLRIDAIENEEDELCDLALHAPMLMHLDLRGTFSPCLIIPSLRYIKITDLFVSEDVGPLSNTTLLESFRSTPMLEELVLGLRYEFSGRALTPLKPILSNPILPGTSAIPLPKLSYAQISAPLHALIDIIKNFDMPTDMSLNLIPRYQYNDSDESLLPLLDALSPRLRNPCMERISIAVGLNVDVCLASADAYSEPTARLFLRTSVYGGINDKFKCLAHYLSQYLVRMEPTNITTFHACSCQCPSKQSRGPATEGAPQDCATLLHQLPSLTALSVSCQPALHQPFLCALESCLAPETLETFTVYTDDARATASDKLRPQIGLSPSDAQPALIEGKRRWESILAVLGHRVNNDRRLKRLILKGTRSDEASMKDVDARALREAAKLVEEVIDERTL
ncbi:unnamed protein product [Peniophora sp. CBMAI 1063]|nr:unnamed protein product [Peniophora sp. CBMAI 1063]